MGYGKRRDWRRNGNQKGRARPKLALAGAIILAIGILLIYLVIDIRGSDPINFVAFGAVLAGTLMLLFSMSRRNQIRFAKGIDRVRETFRDNCQCCKCQNCGRNHNHWTHD